MWDLNSNQAMQIAQVRLVRSCNVAITVRWEQSCLKLLLRASPQHDGPIKSIHWIKAPNYSCIMTGSWDKTLKVRQNLHFVVVTHTTSTRPGVIWFPVIFVVLGHSLSKPNDVLADARAMLLCRCCKQRFLERFSLYLEGLVSWFSLSFFQLFCFLTGVPDGSSGHSREGPYCIPVGKPALGISQNRLASQTSGKSPYFLSQGS